MTLDRLDTFSVACLSAIGAPITANNLGNLRTWAHFECTPSESGLGLITCWNPWAIEGAGGCNNDGCGTSLIASYSSCAAGVAAAVNRWNADVPAIVAALRANAPFSQWTVDPILCQLGYWIHGVECAGAYTGWGTAYQTATTGSPDPQWGCPFPSPSPSPSPSTTPIPSPSPSFPSPSPSPTVPAPSSSDDVALALFAAGAAAGVLYLHQHPGTIQREWGRLTTSLRGGLSSLTQRTARR